jgi:glycine dehydrogenase subunit 1
MPYIPNSDEDRTPMLKRIGVNSVSDLFDPIPANLRLGKLLDLPPALDEPELIKHLEGLAAKNQQACISFVGGGIYNHFVPPVVWSLVMRPEFATAYTPYQAEVAQGTLQAIYEFQTHLCRLTGMDVANASLYDGATAMAEAALLAVAHTGRNRIVVSETVSPFYLEVLRSTVQGRELDIALLPAKENMSDFREMDRLVNDQTACLILAQPNYFGYLEDIEKGEKAVHAAGGLFVQVFDPISLGILKSPAENNADIAIGEGQTLGIPQNFGGPLLGLFSCKNEFVRRIPGRLVARTTDAEGKNGFVLTLQTREQHIRREKATSNICTNEALCATAATIYLSLMGKKGIPRVARLATERAHYLAQKIAAIDGYSLWSADPFFKEFVVKTPIPPAQIIESLAGVGIAAGIDLSRIYPKINRHLMVAVTEMNSLADCDAYATAVARLAAGRRLTESPV